MERRIDSGQNPDCLICLEPAQADSPLFLLACGCKVSWFHLPCELRFLETCRGPISCPVCKRRVALQTNYCFSPRAGPIQRLLWNVIIFTPVEFAILPILPVQTVLLFCIPFMIKSEPTVDFFLLHAYGKQLLVISAFFFDTFFYTRFMPIILVSTYVHVFINLLVQIQARQGLVFSREPLEPFAISRQIKHARIFIVDVAAEAHKT